MSPQNRQIVLNELPNRSHRDFFSSSQTSVHTGRGDAGNTQLLFGRPCSKTDDRIKLLSLLDTSASFINYSKIGFEAHLKHIIDNIQKKLVSLMAEIATHEEDFKKFSENYFIISEKDIEDIADKIEDLENGEIKFTGWIQDLSIKCAEIDIARSFVRQSEISAWELAELNKIRPILPKYLNYLSDLLWVMSRVNNRH